MEYAVRSSPLFRTHLNVGEKSEPAFLWPCSQNTDAFSHMYKPILIAMSNEN